MAAPGIMMKRSLKITFRTSRQASRDVTHFSRQPLNLSSTAELLALEHVFHPLFFVQAIRPARAQNPGCPEPFLREPVSLSPFVENAGGTLLFSSGTKDSQSIDLLPVTVYSKNWLVFVYRLVEAEQHIPCRLRRSASPGQRYSWLSTGAG